MAGKKRKQFINGIAVSLDTPTDNDPFNCGHCGGYYMFPPNSQHTCICGVVVCKPECKSIPLKCRNAYKAQELAAQGFSESDATCEIIELLQRHGADVFDSERTVHLQGGFAVTSYGGYQFRVTVEAI